MADGISRIAVTGFKSISERQEIEIAPLTILAGANNSGKSSIMQPLLMLKQTLEQTTDPGPLWIGGPNVKFTSSEQFFSKTNQASGRFSVEIAVGQASLCVAFGRGSRFAVEILEETCSRNGASETLRPDMPSDEILEVVKRTSEIPPFGFEFAIVANRFFLSVKPKNGPVERLMEGLEPFVRNVIHVPGRRANPDRTYPIRAVNSTFPGTFEPYSASVIDSWQRDDSRRYAALNSDLQHTGLAGMVRARRMTDVEIDVLVSRVIGGEQDDMVSIADVGFGVSQTLPVLVALRAAESGQLVYLEEPEMHLHPRAQVKLADILADAAKRGVRVVAETHSALLLRAVQTLIARGGLVPNLVRFHWFSRDTSGVTQVRSRTPDENGAFGDWPEDFGDVALQSEKEYLDAVESKLAR